MKIRRVTLRRVEMPLKFRFRTSFGETTMKKFLLVELDGGDHSGWGECVADDEPLYSAETNETARHLIRDFFVPILLAEKFAEPEDFLAHTDSIRGNRMARSAVETALWDLFGRERGVSISKLLGGVRDEVAVGVSLGLQASVEVLLDLVERHVGLGYKRIKLKIEPGRDVEIVRAARSHFPGVVLTADANAAYTLIDAKLLARLDAFGLDYLEQPLDDEDLWQHAELARKIRTPICLDESIRSAADARVALTIGAARVINIKIGRVGGFAESRKIHDAALAAGIPVWCGGMLESGVGRAANIQLATLPGFTKPGDTSSASRYFEEDIVLPKLEARGGLMPVPAGPGIGVDVRRDVLERFTVAKEEF